jgi:CubicO group peptidase (beta-lactamase class C family)
MYPLLSMLCLLVACRSQVEYTTPIEPDHPWPIVEPDEDLRARLEATWRYHEDQGGLSMLVVQGEGLVFEAYTTGYEASTPRPLHSGTKTFSCAMAMAGVDRGLLSLDEAVAQTLPEFADDREGITIEHLLRMVSGLEEDWKNLTVDGYYGVADQNVEDKYAYALARPLVHPPGEVFYYSSVHHMVFGELMTRKLSGDPLDWLEETVLDPIGFRYAGWVRDPAGNPLLPYGAWTTAAEWLRLGVLLRDDGLWQGQRVLPEGTLSACSTGSAINPAFGLSVWVNQPVPDDLDLSHLGISETSGPFLYPDGPTDLIASGGAWGQRLYIVPSEDMVVAVLADSRGFDDAEFLSLLLPGSSP